MIALTGGAGSMGLRLARFLRERGESVRILDLPSSSSRAEVNGFEFRACDVRRVEDLDDALRGADAVVHLAALVLSGENAPLLDAVNHLGTANVLAAARRVGIRRIVHVSSISVTYRRQNAYSLSKRRAEDAVRHSGLDWTIVQPTLAWGDSGAVEHERFVRTVRVLPLLPLPGAGRALKSPVHVDDLAQAFASCLSTPNSIGGTIALSGPRAIALRDMASEIRSTHDLRGMTVSVPIALAHLLAKTGSLLRSRTGIAPFFDWQTFTGLVEDAAPSCIPASEVLRWKPRTWSPGT